MRSQDTEHVLSGYKMGRHPDWVHWTSGDCRFAACGTLRVEHFSTPQQPISAQTVIPHPPSATIINR